MSTEMTESTKGFYHSQLPAEIRGAMNLVCRMAGESFRLADKLAVDRLFEFVARQELRAQEAEADRDEYAWRLGIDDEEGGDG